jgi:phage terminase large subunit
LGGTLGSGKSTFFAGLMIEEHLANRGFRSVCLREVQRTLRDSAKRLLEDQINKFELHNQGFKIWKELIETPGDGVITFSGLSDLTSSQIKSLEGIQRAWVEEAQGLSRRSYELLTPTIRAPGSEIWLSFNPRLKTDICSIRFQGNETPTDAIVVKANWHENPWFPKELEQERLDCLRFAADRYPHIWDGDFVTVNDGAYYATQLIEAKNEGRISFVARDNLMSIRAFFDIGGTGLNSDAAAIIIAQYIGKEIRILNSYQAQGQPLSAHVQWLRDNGYAGCQCVLPHDGVTNDRIYAVSYESALQEAGFDVVVIPNQGRGAAMQRVEALRRLFPSIWFNKDKCEGLIDNLGWYHPKFSPLGVDLGPEHDHSSHICDAAGLLAVAFPILVDNPQNHRPIDYSRHNLGIV